MKQIIEQANWPGRPLAVWLVRAAALCAALALALAGCGAQPGSAGEGTAVPSPSAGPKSPPACSSPAPGGTASAAPSAAQTAAPDQLVTALPGDGYFGLRCSDPATGRVVQLLLQGGEPVPEPGELGFWLEDLTTGKTAARSRALMSQESDYISDWLLYDLEGGFLLHCGRACPAVLLGCWLLLYTGQYDYENGWLLNLDTGEKRFNGCSIPEELAPDVFLLSFVDGQPPVLVNGRLEVLRRFDGYAGAEAGNAVPPGYVQLYSAGGKEQKDALYSLNEDAILPGEFCNMVDRWQQLAQFRDENGTAVFRLDPFERVGEYETLPIAREYAAYTPQLKLYTLPDERLGTAVHYLERSGRVTACEDFARIDGGYFVLMQDGSALLLDEEGRETGSRGPRPGAQLCPCGTQGLPALLYSWQCGWEFFGQGGAGAQGSGTRSAHLFAGQNGRYILHYTPEWQAFKNQYTLLSAEGGVLLQGLDALEATTVPGVWAVQKEDTVGLMNEAGQWLWHRSISAGPAGEEGDS